MRFPPNNHQVGEIVTVKAWWSVPEGQLIKCQIDVVSQPFTYGLTEYRGGYMVHPADNPGAHGRFVNPDAVVE